MGPVPGACLSNMQRTEATNLTVYHVAGAWERRAVKHQLLRVLCRDFSVCPNPSSKQPPSHKPAVEGREQGKSQKTCIDEYGQEGGGSLA